MVSFRIKCDFCGSGDYIEKVVNYKNNHYKKIVCKNCNFAWFFIDNKNSVYNQKYYEGEVYLSGYEEEESSFSKIVQEIVNLKKTFIKTKNPKLLDIGCAYGFLLTSLPNSFNKYGIDESAFAIRKAKKNNPNSNLKKNKLSHKLPFKDNFFDFITIIDTLEHLEKPYSVLRECKRILKKKGIIIIKTYNSDGLLSKILGKKWREFCPPYHLSFLNIDKVARYLAPDFKFITLESKGFCYYPSRFKKVLESLVKPFVNKLNIGDKIKLVAIKK